MSTDPGRAWLSTKRIKSSFTDVKHGDIENMGTGEGPCLDEPSTLDAWEPGIPPKFVQGSWEEVGGCQDVLKIADLRWMPKSATSSER
jgi:hypothetical protein